MVRGEVASETRKHWIFLHQFSHNYINCYTVSFFFPTGDKAFGAFLSDEIKEEATIQKSKTLPKMSGGWELEMNGTEAKLSRNVAGEK